MNQPLSPAKTHPLTLPIQNKLLLKLVGRATKLDHLTRIYDQWSLLLPDNATDSAMANGSRTANIDHGPAFLNFVLSSLNVSLSCENGHNLDEVPTSGPLIIVSNHPLGGLEGMLLAQLLLKIRPDLKVLANHLLLKFPEFSQLFIGVDVLNENKTQANSKGIRALSKHLSAAGAVLIFPAGTVSRANVQKRNIEDPRWHDVVGRMAQKYQATCLPIHISARNNMGFYLTGLINKRLRTALLAREMVGKSGATITAHIGETIAFSELKHLDSAAKVSDYLRICSDVLPQQTLTYNEKSNINSQIKAHISDQQIRAQLDELAPYCLIEQQTFKVYCAPYDKLGCVMEQIAISREETFRAVDEGTGKELDSDRFDPYYWHLWVWDEEKNAMVGAYRLGKTDEIVNSHGIDKLYSRSLYHYDQQFINRQGGTLEVGRSFISPTYQGHPRVLDLLWRGIGSFMVANPQYHTLFGCVSVSQQYSRLARAFLADTLLENFSAQADLCQSVTPIAPFAVNAKPWSSQAVKDFAEVPVINKLLGRIDIGKRIPILIRHYLALKGRFISFTVNEGFNHSLDGLLIVDLRQSPDKYVNRYLGKEGAKLFNARWKNYESAA